MKAKTKYYYLIVGFLFGFMLSLIGMTVEDYQHNIIVTDALSDLNHFIAPTLIGLFVSTISYFYWIKKGQQISTYNKLIEIQEKNETELKKSLKESINYYANKIIEGKKII